MNHAGRTGAALTALATAAGAAAVVTVLVTAAVATQKFAGRQTDAAPVTGPTSSSASIEYPSVTPVTSTVFEDGQIVTGDTASSAYFEVPSRRDGWTTSTLEDWIEIPAVIDGPKPRALQPASYRKGYCEADPEDSLAYVGLGVPLDPDGVEGSNKVKGANELIMKSWRAALAHAAKEDQLGAPVVQPARELTLDDGTTAWMSSLKSPWQAEEQDCGSSRVAVNLLSIDTGRRIATVTAFRFLDTGADVPAETLQKILESVRPLSGDVS